MKSLTKQHLYHIINLVNYFLFKFWRTALIQGVERLDLCTTLWFVHINCSRFSRPSIESHYKHTSFVLLGMIYVGKPGVICYADFVLRLVFRNWVGAKINQIHKTTLCVWLCSDLDHIQRFTPGFRAQIISKYKSNVFIMGVHGEPWKSKQ